MSAHGKHSSNPGYKAGDNWVTCDICGMDIYASDSKTLDDGQGKLIVCPEDWNVRHPQDFVRARKDKIAADITRPVPTEIDVSPTLSDQGADTSIPDGTFNSDTL